MPAKKEEKDLFLGNNGVRTLWNGDREDTRLLSQHPGPALMDTHLGIRVASEGGRGEENGGWISKVYLGTLSHTEQC